MGDRVTYSRLGDYIREVNVRNRDLEVTRLLGVSIQKVFMPSIANTIGTDMATYKIVEKGQFGYGPVTSRNGDKVSIALLTEYENAIVSQAYTVFEVVDRGLLLPEYLMMWFRRAEFDRYARFKSHGSAREIFGWDEMCDTLLPIPSLTVQREIVAEYEALSRRIAINEKLFEKLEQTAGALYRKMFVDNIDPENLPNGWRIGTLSDVAEYKNGKTLVSIEGDFSIYGGNGIVGKHNEHNAQNVIVVGRVGINCGSLFLERNRCWVNDNAIMATPKYGEIDYLYWLMRSVNLNSQSEGSGQPLLTQGILNAQNCIIPNTKTIDEFCILIQQIVALSELKKKEIYILIELKKLLLSKLAIN